MPALGANARWLALFVPPVCPQEKHRQYPCLTRFPHCVVCPTNRVASGKASDLPVYFGDAGSPAVLHSVGAERAACAVVTLDTPGANYRSVWAMHKHFPEIKTYVRAHDINHGINLEKAGATVVVPETLEPSMQLAANVLSQFKLPPEEIVTHLDNFRKKHLRELQALAALSGGWYGCWFG